MDQVFVLAWIFLAMIAAALTSSVVDFEDYSPSFQSGSATCISIIHSSMTDRILHSSAQKRVLPATKESAAAYRLNRAEIIGNGFFCFWIMKIAFMHPFSKQWTDTVRQLTTAFMWTLITFDCERVTRCGDSTWGKKQPGVVLRGP